MSLRCIILGLIFGLASNLASAQGCSETGIRAVMNALSIDPSLISITSIEIPSCHNIRVESGSVAFILDGKNLKINGGTRSEIAIDYPFKEGDTVEYMWSFLIPSVDPPGSESGAWWSLAQWHDQPDRRIGQTWEKFKAQPPPLALMVERRNGVVYIGIGGTGRTNNFWTPVPMDEWLDVSTTIRWSTGDSGSFNFRVARHPEISFQVQGRNMLNSFQHYMKLGQYRAPWVKSTATVFFKKVSISLKESLH